ncbi:archease [Nonomuraea sp. K274]|uniref:Archease n=1 Tax=Nonomuraea cypriaca TaxID=1187855 RepID=A0A931AES3_9ACTN|nr:archease [Nonomuraea cypriaca]MBF8190603.1 archease [Nonomuraea cypriaca]
MSRGHRAVSHIAGIEVEAWADTREECLAEAVRALVETITDVGDAVPDDCVVLVSAEEDDETLLAAVLGEVIRQAEGRRVAVDVSVDERTKTTQGQIEVRLATVTMADHLRTAPMAVAMYGLRFGRTAGAWRAHVNVEVRDT